MVTSQAVEVPMTMVPTPTPSISQSVLPAYTQSTVETRWLQMPSEGPNAVKTTDPIGIATNKPIATAMNVQMSRVNRCRREPSSSAAFA